MKLEQAARQVDKTALRVEQDCEEALGEDGMVMVVPLDAYNDMMEAITALREALAEQAEQEPVAWLWVSEHGSERLEWEPVEDTSKWKSTPLYPAPVQKAKQEPVGWTAASNIVNDGYGHSFSVVSSEPANTTGEPYVPLYAAPVRTKDLTDNEIAEIVREVARGSAINRDGSTSHRIARAVIQEYRRKNGTA